MNENQQILGTEPVGKLLMKYSLPAIIGMIVNGLYNVVDRIFIGNIPNVGPLAIAGLGVTMPIMTILLAFGMLIGVGATANISIKLGQGKKDEAETLIGNAITLAVILGVLICIIGLIFGDQILQMFGASESSLPYAKAYIDIILLGSVFNLLGFVFNNIIRGDGNPKFSAIIMIVGCITNIVLDALLIMVFNMGIQGAAIATVTSQLVTNILGFSYYLRGKSNLKLRKSSLKLDKSLVIEMFAIGCAPFSLQIAGSCVQVICNNSLGTYGGDLAIGAMATINSIVMLTGLPIVGISQGAQPIIGFNYGAKKYDRVDKTLKLCIIAATVLLTGGWLLVQLVPQPIVSMFNNDSELVTMTVDGIKKYLSLMPLIGLTTVGSSYFQAIGNAKKAMFLSLLRQVILLIPMMFILPKMLGLNGVWFAQPIADFISFVVTFVLVCIEVKSHKIKKNDEIEVISVEI